MSKRQGAPRPAEKRETVAEQVGHRIRYLRTRRHGGKLTQSEVARRAGMSVSFLSMVERGERTASLETLDGLARALGVPLVELFHFSEALAAPNPAVEKLLEFARQRSLGKEQIDQLLAVARAMFT